MIYGHIPTWQECDEMRDALNDSNRTIEQSLRKPCLDPVEQFVLNHEPHDKKRAQEFRADLQSLIDFIGEVQP